LSQVAEAVGERAGRRPRFRRVSGERRRELLIYWAYRFGEWAVGHMPRRLLMLGGSAAGNLAYDLAPGKRALLHENLGHALGLPPADRRVHTAARRAFRNYGKYLVDVLRMASMSAEEIDRLVTIENHECLADARRDGNGVLICAVHVAAMDMVGPALLTKGESMYVVADDTSYGRLYDHMKEVRGRQGLQLIGWRNLRGLYRVLREGGGLVLFCDVGYRRGDVPVEFLGEATTFPLGPANLSVRTSSPMLPVYCRRTSSDEFIARGLPLIRATSSDPAELYRATQELADALGAVIAEDPGQWYMFRPIWPQTDADRAQARAALDAARRGEDWTRLTGA
jgi:KDO2-lipid IV(A) lauroyltransferase